MEGRLSRRHFIGLGLGLIATGEIDFLSSVGQAVVRANEAFKKFPPPLPQELTQARAVKDVFVASANAKIGQAIGAKASGVSIPISPKVVDAQRIIDQESRYETAQAQVRKLPVPRTIIDFAAIGIGAKLILLKKQPLQMQTSKA